MRRTPLLVTAFALARTVVALTEFQYLQAAKDFADSFLSPRNAEIAASINSTLFAEDVRGTIDASTNFDGRMLSTEYMFGLLANVARDPMDPSPIGEPISYTISHVLVQHNTVVAGIKFEFFYAVLNRSWPIEMEFFFNFNERGQITEYDAIFRRWDWAMNDIWPNLVPHMARWMGMASTNATEIFQQYLARKVCTTALQYCTGENEQYASYDQCMGFVLDKPLGQFDRVGQDNLLCRFLHKNMLSLRPSVHCPHVGPSGGDMCIPRDYTEVVRDDRFPQGFLAVDEKTPENDGEKTYTHPGSSEPLDPLLEISLSRADMHSWDPTLFATCTFGYFLVLWAMSKIVYMLLIRYHAVFQLLRRELQKNVVMYIMNIIFTTIALALQLSSMPIMVGRYRLWMIQHIRVGAAMICGLYAFELIYRSNMRWPLVMHHLMTIFAISVAISVMEITASMSFVISSTIWAFQATVEQSMFVGLLGYRLKWPRRTVTRILKFSAVQALGVKMASSISLIVYWGVKQSHFTRPVARGWAATVWILNIGLMCTQIWGSWVTWKIGERVARDDSWPEDTRKLTATFPYNYRRLSPLGSQATSDPEVNAIEDESDSEGPSPTTPFGYTAEDLMQPPLPKSAPGYVGRGLDDTP